MHENNRLLTFPTRHINPSAILLFIDKNSCLYSDNVQQEGENGSTTTSYGVLSACMKEQGMKEIHREDMPFVIR